MKFSGIQGGQLGLLLVACVMVSSCNKEEYFKAEEYLVGDDAVCFQDGPDLESCHQLGDRCRAAYVDSADGSGEPEFFMCISNPDYSANGTNNSEDIDDSSEGSGTVLTEDTAGSTSGSPDGSSTSGSTDGSSTSGSTDGSSTSGSTDGSSTSGSTDGSSTSGSTDGSSTSGSTTGSSSAGSNNGSSSAGGNTGSSTAGGNNGSSSAGGNNGSSNSGSTSGTGSNGSTSTPVVNDPIKEAYETNCKNLDEKYLWTKKEVTKSGTKTTHKIKLCHRTSSSVHNIVVACPSLKAHIGHEDYFGICR